MATSGCKHPMFMAFLCLAFLLSTTNGLIANCATLSGSFKGPCIFKGICRSHCKNKEGADGGDCNRFKCYCEKNCGNLCERCSGTWKGLCLYTQHCDRQCRQQENAVVGYCKDDFQCICASYC